MTIDEMIQMIERENARVGPLGAYTGNMEAVTNALRSQEARLKAADELATYAERHLNYSDTRIPSLIAAYRNAGGETK